MRGGGGGGDMDRRGSLQQPPQSFTYDRVFSEQSRQSEIYDVAVAPVVLSVLEGYNGSIIAYGPVVLLILSLCFALFRSGLFITLN